MDATLQTLYVAHSRMMGAEYNNPYTAVEVVAEDLFGKTERAKQAAQEAGRFIYDNGGKLNGNALDLFYQNRAKRPNAW
jgi:hypothetical protein